MTASSSPYPAVTPTFPLPIQFSKMNPGTEVIIKGLINAAQYNAKAGFVTSAAAPEGRVGVKLTEGGKILSVKPDNLEVRDSEKKALSPSIVPSPLFGLPPVKDEWGLTDLSAYKDSSLNSFKQAAFRSSTPEAAEKAVFLALHEGKVGYEPMTFPWLFPMGTGHFAQNRRTGLRFEEHVRHLLRQSTGVFLEDEMWLDFAVSRAAILRYATGLPPMYKEEQENGGKGTKLEDTHTTILNQFMKAFPKKAFSIRYLLGDEEFHGLAMIIMFQFTPEQRAEVIMK